MAQRHPARDPFRHKKKSRGKRRLKKSHFSPRCRRARAAQGSRHKAQKHTDAVVRQLGAHGHFCAPPKKYPQTFLPINHLAYAAQESVYGIVFFSFLLASVTEQGNPQLSQHLIQKKEPIFSCRLANSVSLMLMLTQQLFAHLQLLIQHQTRPDFHSPTPTNSGLISFKHTLTPSWLTGTKLSPVHTPIQHFHPHLIKIPMLRDQGAFFLEGSARASDIEENLSKPGCPFGLPSPRPPVRATLAGSPRLVHPSH